LDVITRDPRRVRLYVAIGVFLGWIGVLVAMILLT
jgi:hypothetical protein